MMLIRLTIAAMIASLWMVPSIGRADTAMGQLVYNFTYSAKQNIAARDDPDNAETYGVMTDQGPGGNANNRRYERNQPLRR